MGIIGRQQEVNELNELYNSGKAEYVVIYGRRRVGKTFLGWSRDRYLIQVN